MDKVAVIGLGSIAERHRKNLRLLFPNAEILSMSASGRYVPDPPENADSLLLTIDELINEKPNLVIDASPSSKHCYYSGKIIDSSIDCLIEKPVASTLSQCESLLLSDARSSSQITVGYCLRYLTSTNRMKSYIDEECFGRIHSIYISTGQYLPDWRPNKNYLDSVSSKKELGGGVLLELSHEIDLLMYLFGRVRPKYANLKSSEELSLTVEDIADVVFETENGDSIFLHLDFLQRSSQREFIFITEKGRVIWDLLKNSIECFSHKGRKVLFDDPYFDKNQMYILMLKDCVQGGSNRTCSLQEAVKVVEVIDKVKAIC